MLDKISHFYANDKDYIATFAGTVFEAYSKGDKVAAEIIYRNISRLYYLIKKTHQMYDCGNIVVVSGGLVSQKKVLSAYFEKFNDEKLKFIFNEIPPITGAAVCCVKKFCDEVKDIPDFRRKFMESYSNYLR